MCTQGYIIREGESIAISFVYMYILGKTFVEHGGDSLTAMQFTATVKKLFGINLNVDTLLSSNLSLNQLRDLISKDTSDSSTGSIKNDTLDLMKSDMKLELPIFGGPKSVDVRTTKSVFLTGVYAYVQAYVFKCPRCNLSTDLCSSF